MLQYIGARYVPIFYQNSLDPNSSEWENNVTYEPLTWVSLPNGHMYISKKEVPSSVGTPAQNADYWLEAGQYNAYIQSLQDQIDEMKDGNVSGSLQNQIDTMNDGDASGSLQNQINTMNDGDASGSLQNQIDTMNDGDASGSLQNQINAMKDGSITGSLQNQITSNKNNITALSRRTSNTRNKKILFIGDSYARWFVDNLYCIFDYAAQDLGCAYTVSAAAGRGFTNINSSGTFLELLQGVVTDRDTYTDIVVCGGCNDYDTVANTRAAIRTFCDYAFANFPNAKVSIGMIGGFTNHATSTSQILNKALPAYRECGRSGARYLYNVEYAMWNIGSFRDDGVHPTDDAIQRLGHAIAEAFVSGEWSVEYVYDFTPTPLTGSGFSIGTSYLPNSYVFQHNNRVGFGTRGYQYCSVLISNQSQCITSGIFESKILSGFDFRGFPTNWSTGLYSAPVQLKVQRTSSIETVMGMLYANKDGSVTLSAQGLFWNDISKLDVVPMGYCDTEFDLTR